MIKLLYRDSIRANQAYHPTSNLQLESAIITDFHKHMVAFVPGHWLPCRASHVVQELGFPSLSLREPSDCPACCHPLSNTHELSLCSTIGYKPGSRKHIGLAFVSADACRVGWQIKCMSTNQYDRRMAQFSSAPVPGNRAIGSAAVCC